MRISDWSSDVCSSDLAARAAHEHDTLVVVITGGHGELFWQRFSGVTLDPLSEMASTPIPTLASLLPDERVFGTGAPALTAARGWGEAVSLHPNSADFLALPAHLAQLPPRPRSEEHTSELQSLMRNSYAVFALNKKNTS